MKKVFETIQKRISIRTYDNKAIAPQTLEALTSYMEGNMVGPFGNTVICKIIDAGNVSEAEIKEYVAYGNIKGARLFIAGSVTKGPHADEDYGYVMEKNILKATELGLGTVWLGGSPNRSTFADRLGISDGAIIPAITPIGYASENRTIKDKLFRTFSGGKNRLPFEELFFLGNLSTPLKTSDCKDYEKALEAVRLAPSASNKQPWRILKDIHSNTYHFYLKHAKGYKEFNGIKIQNNDMGIAMSHFELTARELGLAGKWQMSTPNLEVNDLIYITSWIG